MVTLMAVQAVFMIFVGVAGIVATRDSNAQLKSVYEDRAVPLAQLFEINDRMKENSIVLYDARAKCVPEPSRGRCRHRQRQRRGISRTWAEYVATYLTPEEKMVAESSRRSGSTMWSKAIKPGLALLGDRKYDDLYALWSERGTSCSRPPRMTWIGWSLSRSRRPRQCMKQRNAICRGPRPLIAIAAMGLLLSGWIGFQTIRAIGRPLAQLNDVMAKIAQGLFNPRSPSSATMRPNRVA